MGEAGDVGHQVALADLGQIDGVIIAVVVRDEIGRVPLRHSGRAKRPGLSAGDGELEDGGLLVATHEGHARRLAGSLGHHRTTFSIAST